MYGTHLHHLYATQLPDLCEKVAPQPVRQPKLLCKNHALIDFLGLQADFVSTQSTVNALYTANGSFQLNSVAQKYGGHQFGQWNPYLGDGRGLLLGECLASDGKYYDLHLKGSGPTPFSRGADGRAVLRSSIREYIASEAMHHLGIPSSRAVALMGSSEPVLREQKETAAMLFRSCPSHIRFGHFEYYFHTKETEKLESLFEFCFNHHFTQEAKAEEPYLALLTTICRSTARLIAKWQAYGFNHGVMNTDNMSIHGITFDYGPYAFLDDFVPDYICNRSDHSGRYVFDQQPSIGLWNLNALASAFTPYLSREQIKQALSCYEPELIQTYHNTLFARLGLTEVAQASTPSELQKLVAISSEFMTLLAKDKADLHLSYRALSEQLPQLLKSDTHSCKHDTHLSSKHDTHPLHKHFKSVDELNKWLTKYREALESAADRSSLEKVQEGMLNFNPKFVMRNHHIQRAIADAEQGDMTVFHNLVKVAQSPFSAFPTLEHLSEAPSPEEKGISLSCSS